MSTNGSSWTNAYATTNGDGGIDDLAMSANARYVRMNGTRRATPYGFSLWDLEVFGPCTSTPPPTTQPDDDTTHHGPTHNTTDGSA